MLIHKLNEFVIYLWQISKLQVTQGCPSTWNETYKHRSLSESVKFLRHRDGNHHLLMASQSFTLSQVDSSPNSFSQAKPLVS